VVFAEWSPEVAIGPADPGPRPRVERVCLVIGQLGLGGAEKQLALLAAGLHRRGVEVTVVVLRSSGPREDILREAGVPLINLGLPSALPLYWKSPLVLALALGRLWRTLLRLRPQVVHAYLLHSYLLTPPMARLARVPVCVAGRRSLGDFKAGMPVALACERVATRMTDLLIANANAVADEVVRGEGVARDRIRVVYNGLAASAFEPALPAELSSALPVVVCVANLNAAKGHRYLIAAATRLRERGLACTLALVGAGPEEDRLRHQADLAFLDVRFLGARTDVAALLARADVVVLPSLSEGMSNALMEAMAAGRPIVATNVGGTAELIEGRGILVPPADADALAAALERVLRNPADALLRAEAAREWSRRHLQLDSMVDRHLAIYSELLEARCAG